MRREYKFNTKLSNENIEEIWKNIYAENPNIKSALLRARAQDEEAQELVTSLFEAFYNSELAQDVAKVDKIKDRLYKYWEEAGLESSPEEVFSEYLNEHISEYLTLDAYDYSKPAWDENQSRVGRNNMLITLMQKRLEDPQTVKDRTTPGGFPHASAAAKYIRKLQGIDQLNYDYSDPWTMVVYNQQNQIAGKLIGIFANQNTNNAIASLMKEFSLVQPISFGNHPQGLSNLLNPNALTKELLAASVDAVKDPVLNFLNLNTITADSAGMLCRLGYSFEEIGLLMNQPIIKELCDYCMDNNMSDIDTAINNLLQDWGARGNYADQPTSSLTVKLLERGIIAFRDNPNIKKENQNFINTQAQVLELFRTIYATAKDVGAFVTNTKFTASNAVKSTFGGMYAQQDRVTKYVNSFSSSKNPRLNMVVSDYVDSPITLNLDINNIESYMSQILNNPFGYEQVMYDANVQAIKELCKYYPYNNSTYSNVRYFMSGLTKSGLDETTIDQIHEYMLRYMIGLDEQSKFNPEFPINLDNGETVTTEDYYTKYVPLKVSNLISYNEELKSLPIFSLMVFEEDNNGNVIMKIADSGALTPSQKEEIRDSWELLLTNPELSQVAKDLYMYSYYQSGFGFGVVGFNHLAPLELKLQLDLNGETSYTDFLNNVLDNNITVDEVKFARMFLNTHRDNNRLVYEPKSKQYTYLKETIGIYKNGLPVKSFILDYNGDNNRVKPFILRSTKKTLHFRPAILIDGMLYIASGTNFNVSEYGAMEYRLVEDKNTVKVNTLSTSTDKSMKTSDNTQKSSISLSTEGYRKGDPQRHPDVNYVFTENAEAYIASHSFSLEEKPDTEFPYKGRTKLNVSDVGGTNQAGIRTDNNGNISPNAYGIIVKKYQQDANGRFVAKEGQFQDTDEDFNLFVSLNEDMFRRLSESSNKKIVFPTQMGLGKAALPKRFAEWLQSQLLERFGISSSIEKNTRADYDGYGLSLTSVESNVEAESKQLENKPINQNSNQGQSDNSSTAIEGEPIVEIEARTVNDLINETVRAAIKSGNLQAEHFNMATTSIAEQLKGLSEEQQRTELINNLINEYKEIGVSCKLNGNKIC